jgi:tetratricopeptide (TPR) repeat protein
VVLCEIEWLRGATDRAFEHLDRARELVNAGGASRVKAYVISSGSRFRMLAGRSAEALSMGREAAAMAEQLGLDEVRASALNNIGSARCFGGDMGGIDDLEEAAMLAERANAPHELCRARANLASVLWTRGDLQRSASMRAEAELAASRFGQHLMQRWLRGSIGREHYVRGFWREAQACVEDFLAEVEAGSPHYLAGDCYMARSSLRLGHDDEVGARSDAERALELARVAKDPQMLYPTLAGAADVFSELGDTKRAAELADELLALLRADTSSRSVAADIFQTLAWTLTRLGRGHEIFAVLPGGDAPWVQATRAFVRGNLRQAAGVCAEMGARTEEARDRLRLAGSLIARNGRAEAEVELLRALDFYDSVGATRYIREAEALLSTPRSSRRAASAG